jgi:hypothetical protein
MRSSAKLNLDIPLNCTSNLDSDYDASPAVGYGDFEPAFQFLYAPAYFFCNLFRQSRVRLQNKNLKRL